MKIVLVRICLALLIVLLAVATARADWEVGIVKVIDGDSLMVRYLGGEPPYGFKAGKKVEVRLQGIDAPEHRQPGGRQAAEALAVILEQGKDWSLEPMGLDVYGRVLGMLYGKGPGGRQWVNEVMVENGHAWVYRKYSQDKRLKRAESKARERRLGLWAQKNPEPPWKYRASRR